MTQLQTMYPGVANSPNTFLKEDLARDATIMYLADGSVLGTLPTLAVIGGGTDAETVLVTSIRSDGGFIIERGVEGYTKAWKKADPVARNWTNKDYETLVSNIKTNDASIVTLREDLVASMQYIQEEAINAVGEKVDKVAGKGLSTNDYDDAAKAKVDGIPANPKYTDTVPDLSPYAKKTEIKTRLADMTEDSTHRTVTDAEKEKWNGKSDIDKQYLYDILMGESLVSKKAGEWPKTQGRPTSIGRALFSRNQLTSVTIPNSVTSIGDYAFFKNQLTEVKIPNSVTSIGAYAFADNQLTEVKIPNSITSIGDNVFSGNQLTEVKIPNSITSIGDSVFSGNQLTEVTIPNNVTSIGRAAFYINQLTSVVIPPSVTNIKDYAFNGNQLTEVKIPKKCTVASNTFDSGVNIIRY